MKRAFILTICSLFVFSVVWGGVVFAQNTIYIVKKKTLPTIKIEPQTPHAQTVQTKTVIVPTQTIVRQVNSGLSRNDIIAIINAQIAKYIATLPPSHVTNNYSTGGSYIVDNNPIGIPTGLADSVGQGLHALDLRVIALENRTQGTSTSGIFNPAFALGSVAFMGSAGLTEDNANFFYDSVNHALGLGTNTPDTTSILDLTSTTKGFLPPRMTTAERDAIVSPAAGLMVFNTTDKALNLYDGVGWTALGGSSYTNANPTPITLGGIQSGSTFTAQTLQNMFDSLLYPYIAPSISLSANPTTGTIREFGNTVTTTTLNGNTTKHTNNITLVDFYRNGVLIHTQASPFANGGTETYVDTTPVTTNGVTFTARAGDGTQTITSNTIGYTFVYPFYYGVGAQGLTGAQIRSTLTSLIKTPSNTVTVTSPTSQVFYLAYPDTSPALTSILDTNGFETFSDYTLRTVTITGLDGTPQTYKVYEYKNVTTQVNFTNTFKF